jgi:hypothetical protein
MAAKTGTYSLIASSTLGSASSSVTFSTISGSYTDIVAVINTGGTTTNLSSLQMRFNSDTGSNYSTTSLSGNGSAASSARYTSQTKMLIGNLADALSQDIKNNCIIHIQDYSNSTTYKTALARFNDAARETNATVHLWRNTNAITSIQFLTPLSDFSSGSTFKLYGIEAGNL